MPSIKEKKMLGKMVIKGQKGFTLVEIAIVMVIIGLLTGGIIQGRIMIQNAKVKRLVSDVEGMKAAVFAYQDRFGMLPGDENDVNTPIGDSVNGDNDGYFDEADGSEIADLRSAELLAGTANDSTLPKNSFGGNLWVDYANIQGAANYVVMSNIPAEVSQELDTKYDDGVYSTGSIRGSAAYTAGTVVSLGWRL